MRGRFAPSPTVRCTGNLDRAVCGCGQRDRLRGAHGSTRQGTPSGSRADQPAPSIGLDWDGRRQSRFDLPEAITTNRTSLRRYHSTRGRTGTGIGLGRSRPVSPPDRQRSTCKRVSTGQLMSDVAEESFLTRFMGAPVRRRLQRNAATVYPPTTGGGQPTSAGKSLKLR